MISSISINTAFCLAASDIEALIQGRMIAAISRTFINAIPYFAICPADISDNNQAIEIRAWARLEICKIYSNPVEIEKLSRLTIWNHQSLQDLLQERNKIFVAYLRVYQLDQAVKILSDRANPDKIGSFIRLPISLTGTTAKPALTDTLFKQRRHQLINLENPQHPELEELHTAIAQLPSPSLASQALGHQIKVFLGWADDSAKNQSDLDADWIKTIASLGDRSKELEGKSNYQAGTDFENITRRGLEYLGFKVDETCKGGAGGLDLFCSEPYPLVGECKAGKSIPDRAVEELDRIGKRHLRENYMSAVRLIIGSGQPTKQLQESSITSKISIISAMTLEKLVKLQAQHPNSINLIELKRYLVPGQVNDEIEKYIEVVSRDIKLRSHIVQIVKEHLKITSEDNADVGTLYGAYMHSTPHRFLTREELREILIELSSPLVGHLGRAKGNDGDRFYFLRDLPIV
ncbi:MAG: DUF1802 family protein [Drouetiella hepatica Uher 2000/2452]|jgi:hypothetical protein|uniref:DUF1802 family protein n=1 Tax=Drouetiella hepatica Uher 2000/2452 TaxID=904376 RepID=A0A951UKZ1_9CYAN|nr:DUF1802 family protein [Drouetiella hepatica Uher 2000/2452]